MMSIGHGGPEATGRLEWPSASIVLEALSRFVSPATIHSVLRQTGRESQRIRRLPAAATVWLVIAIGIWTDLDRDMPSLRVARHPHRNTHARLRGESTRVLERAHRSTSSSVV